MELTVIESLSETQITLKPSFILETPQYQYVYTQTHKERCNVVFSFIIII